MYFKVSTRTNPDTGVYSGYYRLVESYRNHCVRVYHLTILNAGYLDRLTTDQLNLIQKILTTKVANYDKPLFELPCSDDSTVIRYVDEFYNRMVAEKRIDVFVEKKEKKVSRNGKDLQMIDLNSIRKKDVGEIGAEWLSYQAMRQLQIAPFLESLEWSEDEIKLAQSHIISRAVFPASELETTRWIRENSLVCEITSYDIEQVTKDWLYSISKKLYAEKEALEQHLSLRTNELFDIQDKIILYDLCVSRSNLKTYNIEVGAATISVTDNQKQKTELCQVNSDRNTDYYLKVESHSKELKERSMNEQFRARFEAGLQQIADSLTKKRWRKTRRQSTPVHWAFKAKYPSIQRYFNIVTKVCDQPEPIHIK